MTKATFRQQLGTLFLDRPLFAWVVLFPELAKSLGYSWIDFHNRGERLLRSPDRRGFDCCWQWTSDLNLPKAIPSLGERLWRLALAEWPISAHTELLHSLSNPPKVSFVIGHRGSDKIPHLLATVSSILAQENVPIECIVVEQAADPVLPGHLPAAVRYIHTPIPYGMPYARAWAFNLGARNALGDILVFHDNDILIPNRYAEQLVILIDNGYQVARLQRLVFYLGKQQTENLFSSGMSSLCGPMEFARQNCEGHTLAVERNTYFALGGHDESFIGWGGEDNEMFDRCRTVKCYPYGYLPFLHLHHPPQPRPTDPSRLKARLDERLAIPAHQRIKELTARPFGQLTGPIPTWMPTVFEQTSVSSRS